MQIRCLSTKNKSGSRKSDNFYKFYKLMGHNIDKYEKFHQKVIQMMTCDLLQIENEENAIGMISFQGNKVEMCRLQHTKNSPLKLILTRPVVTYNGNYSALPHNYRNSPNIECHTSMFQNKIVGSTKARPNKTCRFLQWE